MFADFGQGCIVELNFRKDEVPPGLSRVKLYGRLPSTCKGTPFIKHLTSHVPPGGIGFRRISP
jgi:hypothetical protein